MSETLTAPPRKTAHRKPMLRKARGQGASRRGEILDAAKRLFIQEGFATATMRRIASEVGVSPTALYLHFADKEAILQAIADDYFSELLAKLQETTSSELPPLSRLRAGLRAYLDFGLERLDEYRLTFQSRAIRANAPPVCAVNEVAEMSFAVLEQSVEELVAGAAATPPEQRCERPCPSSCRRSATSIPC